MIMIGAAAAIGAAIGYAVATVNYGAATRLALTSSYARAGSDVSLDIRTLKAIRENDVPGATRILESRLDLGLVHLSDYAKLVPAPLRQDSVRIAVEDARSYRAKVPSASDDLEVQGAIRRALNLTTDAGAWQ
jgi:hypothetical protein